MLQRARNERWARWREAVASLQPNKRLGRDWSGCMKQRLRVGLDGNDEGIASTLVAAIALGLVLPPSADGIDADNATFGEVGGEARQKVGVDRAAISRLFPARVQAAESLVSSLAGRGGARQALGRLPHPSYGGERAMALRLRGPLGLIVLTGSLERNVQHLGDIVGSFERDTFVSRRFVALDLLLVASSGAGRLAQPLGSVSCSPGASSSVVVAPVPGLRRTSGPG